jgi:hypothetical protein
MPHRVLRLDAPLRIPHKAFRDEINKKLVVTSQDLSKYFRARTASTALGVDNRPRSTCGIYNIAMQFIRNRKLFVQIPYQKIAASENFDSQILCPVHPKPP